MSKSGRGIQSARIVLIMLGVTLWSLLILGRLVQLQVIQHETYQEKADRKQQNSLPAPRGIIYDSQMDELAINATAKNTLEADLTVIENKREVAQELASVLKIDYEDLLRRMMNPKRKNIVVKRRIDAATVTRIESLGINGLFFTEESIRIYPNNVLASQALGFVNMNGDGGAGVELQYDKVLKGKDGLYSFEVDAHQRPYRITIEKPPVQGDSLVLSLDKSIQYVADKNLAAAVENAHAKSGIAIVIESDTGRILAMSNYPPFDSNTYNTYKPDLWKNRAVSDYFEPGSTFKVVVAAAALEAGRARPDEMIDCENGAYRMSGHIFRDHNPYGHLTFKEVLEHSSNIGAIKLGLKLGQQGLYQALLDFGFGSPTNVDLPGEIGGLVRHWKDWSGLSIGAISFGQEVGVTSLQILMAINAIANGGYRVRPSIVDRVIDEQGNVVWENEPEATRIMKPRTAETVTEAFEGVVLRGTGKRAALEGYRAAGKTGTAQKSVNGRYQKGVYISSFIGFAPLPHPEVTVLVQLDEPEPQKGYYGGDVCAPYFKNIAQDVLLYLRVPPDANLSPPEWDPSTNEADVRDFIPNAVPVEPIPALAGQQETEADQDTIMVHIEGEWTVVPDFQGLSKRSVLNRCIELGLKLSSQGSGMAVFQSPPPGTEVPVGSTCSVTFATAKLKNHIASVAPGRGARPAPVGLSSNSPD
jgi:cell division protein FtsI (penicillin-binding protein 3)